MMRRRRNQTYAWRRMTHSSNPFIHLVAWQLPAFAGLCALSHFDLNVRGVYQIFRHHTKSARGNLFDARTHAVAIL